MSTSSSALDWLLRPTPGDGGIDRKTLAGLMLELAKNVDPAIHADGIGVAPVDPRLDQLRKLLVGREIQELARLAALLDDPERLAAAISRALPTAIALATPDARLGQALTPAVEAATQRSIRSDPRTLVNILYPLMVPAMRKAIAETIEETFQSLNEALKHSLSLRGLKWRFEAWRTGTSFATTVLKHTLVYRVEHVFLIHPHTGLLITHVAGDNAESQDPQLVSSMLTAIQDFVRDSFAGAEQQGLDTLRLGELTLWCEPGPFATLVAVIRGNPPASLHETLRTTLTRIHAERPQALENFDGDSSGFADVEAQLRDCVTPAKDARRKPERQGFPWMVVGAAAPIVLLLGLWGFWHWQSERRWDDYVAALRAQPGIVVTEVGWLNGKRYVGGLRDPLAADPQALIGQTKLDAGTVSTHWEPYEALNPEFVLQRLKTQLEPPPTVTLAIDGDKIVASGTATRTWITRLRTAARMLPGGAPSLNFSQVRDVTSGQLDALRTEIQAYEIRFDYNETLPSPGQDQILDDVAKKVNEFAARSLALQVTAHVTITGHSDNSGGAGTYNISLSTARAEAVRALLKKRGVDPDLIQVRGAGALETVDQGASDAERSAINRRVSFTVTIEE